MRKKKKFIFCSLLVFMVLPLPGQIPRKKVILYLDTSQTIITDKDNSPHSLLSDMVIQLLTHDKLFIREQDSLEIYRFGKGEPKSMGQIAGRDLANLGEILDEYRSLDTQATTELDAVIRDISAKCDAVDENDHSIFIIATDMVQDKEDKLWNENSKYFNREKDLIKLAIQGLSTRHGIGFRKLPKNFQLVILNHGDSVFTQNRLFLDRFEELRTLARSLFERTLDATVVDIVDIEYEYRALIETIQNNSVQSVDFTTDFHVSESVREGPRSLTVQVDNPNWFPITMDGLSDRDGKDLFPTFQARELLPGPSMIDMTLPPSLLGQNEPLDLYPMLTPQPSAQRIEPISLNLQNWFNFSVERVVRLPDEQPSLQIQIEIEGRFANSSRNNIKFILTGDDLGKIQGMEKGSQSEYVSLDQGTVDRDVTIIFRDERIDLDRAEDYHVEAETDKSAPMITPKKKTVKGKATNPFFWICVFAHSLWLIAAMTFKFLSTRSRLDILGITFAFTYNCLVTAGMNGYSLGLPIGSTIVHAIAPSLSIFFLCLWGCRLWLHQDYMRSAVSQPFTQTLDQRKAIYGFISFLVALIASLVSGLVTINVLS